MADPIQPPAPTLYYQLPQNAGAIRPAGGRRTPIKRRQDDFETAVAHEDYIADMANSDVLAGIRRDTLRYLGEVIGEVCSVVPCDEKSRTTLLGIAGSISASVQALGGQAPGYAVQAVCPPVTRPQQNT